MSIDPGSFCWTSCARSHPGRVREVNEDSYLDRPDRELWAVADGMGGHSLGEFASDLAVRSLADLPPAKTLDQRVEAALGRLDEVNRRLRDEAQRCDVPIIGTTIAAMLARGSLCSCLWAGDSRIYLYRSGRLTQLTRDHNHIEAARARHAAEPDDDTLERPRANLITRALGAEDRVLIDRVTFELADGDTFLLCSDGLSNEVGEHAIREALLSGICSLACEELVERALERAGRDNITAVVARVEAADNEDQTIIRPRP